MPAWYLMESLISEHHCWIKDPTQLELHGADQIWTLVSGRQTRFQLHSLGDRTAFLKDAMAEVRLWTTYLCPVLLGKITATTTKKTECTNKSNLGYYQGGFEGQIKRKNWGGCKEVSEAILAKDKGSGDQWRNETGALGSLQLGQSQETGFRVERQCPLWTFIPEFSTVVGKGFSQAAALPQTEGKGLRGLSMNTLWSWAWRDLGKDYRKQEKAEVRHMGISSSPMHPHFWLQVGPRDRIIYWESPDDIPIKLGSYARVKEVQTI